MNVNRSTAATIKITPNGPYLVSGRLPLARQIIGTDAAGDSVEWKQGKQYPPQAQYALCRSGASKNKPFCDGAHASIGFSDER